MSVISSTPAASRIAQIRSAMGRRENAGANGAFAAQLDSVRTGRIASPSTFTVGQPGANQPGANQPSTNQPGAMQPSAGQPVAGQPPADTDGARVAPLPTSVSGTVPYALLFNEAGELHDVNPALLASVAQIESAFDPAAISSAGAQGLMQFMPATAGEMGVDAFDPASAVDGAARYLRRELDRFGSVELALAAYNAGPGAVQRHGGIPPFTETQRYVDKVLDALESHR